MKGKGLPLALLANQLMVYAGEGQIKRHSQRSSSSVVQPSHGLQLPGAFQQKGPSSISWMACVAHACMRALHTKFGAWQKERHTCQLSPQRESHTT